MQLCSTLNPSYFNAARFTVGRRFPHLLSTQHLALSTGFPPIPSAPANRDHSWDHAVSLIGNRTVRTATAIVKRKTRVPLGVSFWQSIISHQRYRWYAALLLAFVLFTCVMIVGGVSLRLIILRRTVVVTPLQPINTVREQPALVLSVGIPYINAKPVVPDLCFDFLKTLVGPTIVIDSAADLTALYEKADTSDLCSIPATRYEFDFAKYQIVGAVTVGTGCSLDLLYQATIADDLARTQTVELTRQVVGTCDYELVRPIWLAIERNGYAMSIKIS